MYSDASSSGFAGYEVDSEIGISHGQWADEEKKKSSTWRELKAVEIVLASQAHRLAYSRIKWFSDNQAVVKIVSNGSMKSDLQNIALNIFKICVGHSIFIEMDWIPRSLNEKADFLSKLVDHDDWEVSRDLFTILEQKWGPYSIDRFASYYNKKTVRFNSKYWNPGAEAIDAFTQNWAQENNWLVPPICLLPRVIMHLLQCKAEATLVCPEWRSAPFWTLLFPDGMNTREEVFDVLSFDHRFPLLEKGRGPNGKFVQNITYSRILAIRFKAK